MYILYIHIYIYNTHIYIYNAVKDNTTLRVQQLWYWTFGHLFIRRLVMKQNW